MGQYAYEINNSILTISTYNDNGLKNEAIWGKIEGNISNQVDLQSEFEKKVDKSELTECVVIIESYINGASGYNIYSNRYCEQWGKITGNTGWQTINVSFIKEFKDDYTIEATHTRNTRSAYNDYSSTGIINPNSKGMSINYYSSDTTGTVWWKVCGYLAEDQD